MGRVNGIWGERASDFADRVGCDVRRLEKPIGEVFSLGDMKKGLNQVLCLLFMQNLQEVNSRCSIVS